MALDSLSAPPDYLAPKANRPELIVDEYRVMIMDPTDGTLLGHDGPRGAAGHLGRLVYAQRTRSNRGV